MRKLEVYDEKHNIMGVLEYDPGSLAIWAEKSAKTREYDVEKLLGEYNVGVFQISADGSGTTRPAEKALKKVRKHLKKWFRASGSNAWDVFFQHMNPLTWVRAGLYYQTVYYELLKLVQKDGGRK